jgi:hypothetical protein
MNLEQKRIAIKHYKQSLMQVALFGFIGGIIAALTIQYFIGLRSADIQRPLTGGQVLQAAWPKLSEEKKDAIAAAVATAMQIPEPAQPPQSKD